MSCDMFASLISTNDNLKKLLSLGKTNEKLVELPLYQEFIDKTKLI